VRRLVIAAGKPQRHERKPPFLPAMVYAPLCAALSLPQANRNATSASLHFRPAVRRLVIAAGKPQRHERKPPFSPALVYAPLCAALSLPQANRNVTGRRHA
jgi:hypothetical protein